MNILIKNVFIIVLLLATSACSADNAAQDSLMSAFRIDRDFVLRVGDANWDYYDQEKTRILIENVTPITCSNTPDNNFSSYDHCYVTNNPLPKEITIRYGTRISRQDEDRLYPDPPKFRPMGDDEYYRDYESKEDAYYDAMYKLPKYKKIEEARKAAIEKIDWHTYTIHPQQLMDKYKYKIPEGRKWYRITPHSWSTTLWVTLIVEPDMSVKVDEDYKFFYSGNGSWN